MPTFTTRVETESRPFRTGTFLSAESAPLLRGDGDISHACGNCGAVLVENVSPGDIRSFHALCPACHAVSFIDSEAR